MRDLIASFFERSLDEVRAPLGDVPALVTVNLTSPIRALFRI
jgi:hypothetical protein